MFLGVCGNKTGIYSGVNDYVKSFLRLKWFNNSVSIFTKLDRIDIVGEIFQQYCLVISRGYDIKKRNYNSVFDWHGYYKKFTFS